MGIVKFIEQHPQCRQAGFILGIISRHNLVTLSKFPVGFAIPLATVTAGLFYPTVVVTNLHVPRAEAYTEVIARENRPVDIPARIMLYGSDHLAPEGFEARIAHAGFGRRT